MAQYHIQNYSHHVRPRRVPAQEHERDSNDAHVRAVRLRTQDEEQVQRETGPLGHEALQGEDRQDLPALPALHLPVRRLQLHGKGQASVAPTLHRKARDPRKVPPGSPGRKWYSHLAGRAGHEKEKFCFKFRKRKPEDGEASQARHIAVVADRSERPSANGPVAASSEAQRRRAAQGGGSHDGELPAATH